MAHVKHDIREVEFFFSSHLTSLDCIIVLAGMTHAQLMRSIRCAAILAYIFLPLPHNHRGIPDTQYTANPQHPMDTTYAGPNKHSDPIAILCWMYMYTGLLA